MVIQKTRRASVVAATSALAIGKVGHPNARGDSTMPRTSRRRDRQSRLVRAFIAIAGALVVTLPLAACSDSEPTVPAAPSLDAATAAELRAKALSDAAEVFGVTDPPEVAVIRETSPFDYDQSLIDCLREDGYDAKLDASGGIGVDGLGTGTGPLPEGVYHQYVLTMYVCMAQYPLDEVYLAPLTLEQKNAQADYFLEELPECLEGFGITFATPPSREVFLADFDSRGPWSPYSTAQISSAQWAEVTVACPQAIPPERIWEGPDS